MYFEVIGEITEVETIAVGGSIREVARLRKQFGPGPAEAEGRCHSPAAR